MNVLLSETELEKLKSEFPNDYQKRIEALSIYIASTGKHYKNHLATIRNWARMEKERNKYMIVCLYSLKTSGRVLVDPLHLFVYLPCLLITF